MEENTDVQKQGDQLEVHQAVLAVAQLALGGAPGALQIVELVLTQLSNPGTAPWITIFNRETQSTKTSNFQLSYTEQEGDRIVATLMSFALEGATVVTQVLVFKSGQESLRFSSSRSGAEINTAVLDFIRDDLRDRVAKYASNYISTLPPLV
jgi:hypothetical protein